MRDLDDRIVKLREKPRSRRQGRHAAGPHHRHRRQPEQGHRRLQEEDRAQPEEIANAKAEIQGALKTAGVQLAPEQVDLLLDSVLSGDLVRLVAVFNSAKIIDGQLGKLLSASGENIGAARKYFAMHAALFALLVHAQDR